MSDLLFYLAVGAIMVVSFLFLKRRNRRAAAARTPERAADAARFGWAFEADQSLVFEILRWRGTTSDIAWVAESLRSGQRRHSANRSFTRIIRWFARRPIHVSGAIAMLPMDGAKEFVLPDMAGADASSLGGRLVGAALGTAFDVGFGELGRGIDATALQVVDGLAARYPEHTILATNVDAASAFLFQHLDRVLASAGTSAGTIPVAGLSLLITPEGVAISRKELVLNADSLLPIVTAGVTLATAISERR